MTAAAKRSTVLRLTAPAPRRIRGHVVGTLIRVDGEGPRVDYGENPHGLLLARSTVPLSVLPQAGAVEVLLTFEGERSDAPVIVGVLQPTAPAAARGANEDTSTKEVHARVDGKRVTITAIDEIELVCGEASITLRRNGRVVIRGAYVETRSRGVNRVKGGSVQIN
ncbi:MAG TPA: DUF6484 domain-containing protein [Polyangiaceae bacterium]|jgi:hypothetical protein|nr:DUF6484 domain-containing protein [Polyangiaceae bacterium]